MASGSDLVKVAQAELEEGVSGRPNKYTNWYGMTDEWCAMFVSYCANRAGVPTSVIPKTAAVSEMLSFAKNKGRFKTKNSGYLPNAGDIMIMKEGGASHVGIVEKRSSNDGNIFYTIEGNSSDAVKARHYNLSNSSLSGFFVPAYDGSSTTFAEDTKSTAQESKELCGTVVKSTVEVGGELRPKELYKLINGNGNEYELHIINKGVDYMPLVKDKVKWTTKWQDTPGELTFEILKDSALDIQEGNSVIFRKGSEGIFYGYLFTKERSKDGFISCKAYDQLRYLKSKDTYCLKNRRYDEIVRLIAADYRLTVGTLENTGYVLSRICDNETLFDILKAARMSTKQNTGIDYVLYDNFGVLDLKKTDSLQTDYLLCAQTAKDISYKTSIDEGVYNRIQLYRDNDQTGIRDKYVYQNNELINRWGVLQATYKLENGDNPAQLGTKVLAALSEKKRELTVKECMGDLRLRAGAKIFVTLDLGDVVYKNVTPIITKAVHTFGTVHSCDLTLLGGEPYIGG